MSTESKLKLIKKEHWIAGGAALFMGVWGLFFLLTENGAPSLDTQDINGEDAGKIAGLMSGLLHQSGAEFTAQFDLKNFKTTEKGALQFTYRGASGKEVLVNDPKNEVTAFLQHLEESPEDKESPAPALPVKIICANSETCRIYREPASPENEDASPDVQDDAPSSDNT